VRCWMVGPVVAVVVAGVLTPGAGASQADAGVAFVACPVITLGTAAPDTVVPHATDDGFDALAGQDQVQGGGGHDCLFGGAGNDTVNGGDGADAIAGDDGADNLQGGAGDDEIDALEHTTGTTGGPDTINAGDGDDDVKADDGFADTIDCGPGQDRVDADAIDTVLATCETRMDLTLSRDTTPPTLTLGGELYDVRAEDLTGDAYALDVEADDGVAAGTVSGVHDITITLDGAQVATTATPCTPGFDCDTDLSWTFLRTGQAIGSHTITVTSTDGAGNLAQQTFSVFLSATISTGPDQSEDTTTGPSSGSSGSHPSTGCDGFFSFSGASDVLSVARRDRFQGGETTVRYRDGSYRVSRCDALGRFAGGQVVAPVAVPGGVALLIQARFLPSAGHPGEVEANFFDYADFSEPAAEADWSAHRTQMLARVYPPTH
jgi:hypothetical protein